MFGKALVGAAGVAALAAGLAAAVGVDGPVREFAKAARDWNDNRQAAEWREDVQRFPIEDVALVRSLLAVPLEVARYAAVPIPYGSHSSTLTLHEDGYDARLLYGSSGHPALHDTNDN